MYGIVRYRAVGGNPGDCGVQLDGWWIRCKYNHMVVRRPQVSDDELDRLFRALADRTRRDILRRTVIEGESVSDLAAAYDMSFAAVQKHVAVLEAAGLIHKTPQGRKRLVTADPDQLARAREALTKLEALWRRRIDTLDEILSEPEE